jgi:hypothetical protein
MNDKFETLKPNLDVNYFLEWRKTLAGLLRQVLEKFYKKGN